MRDGIGDVHQTRERSRCVGRRRMMPGDRQRQRQRETPARGKQAARLGVVDPQNGTLGAEDIDILLLGMGNHLGVERREIRCQYQLADVAQDAGGKGEFRVVAGGAGQFAGGQCCADTMPERKSPDRIRGRDRPGKRH